jgi:hypothetical protein
MSEFQDFKRKFSNNRQWREFVAAVHESVTYPCAVTYPKVISALRSGRDWFSDGAARASSRRLPGAEDYADVLSLERIQA